MRLFERFIAIADSLRRDMENFDALMGVLAGMNSQPVFRLTEDLEPLKSRDEYKRFRSLNRLMSNNKSFAAYRMALSSSGPAALPYLSVHFPWLQGSTYCRHSGCHLQDITKVNEGKDDNRNALVNWTKCSQLAKSASAVADCMKHAPTLKNNERIERLIVDAPVHSLEDGQCYRIDICCS
jgi:hypothetical protein